MPPVTKKHHQPLFACRLTDDSLLLAGVVEFVFSEKAVLFNGDVAVPGPYTGCTVESPEGPYYCMIVRDDDLFNNNSTSPLLTVRQPGRADISILPASMEKNVEGITKWYAGLPTTEREMVLSLLLDELAQDDASSDTDANGMLHALCVSLQMHTDSRGLELKNSWWLSPSIIYGECEVNGDWLEDGSELLLLSESGMHRLPTQVFQVAGSVQAFIAMADEALYDKEFEKFRITFSSNKTLYALDCNVSSKAFQLEFVGALKSRPVHQVTQIRENICQALLGKYRDSKPAHVVKLIEKLQHYVSLPPAQLVDPSLPFNLYVDRVIPVACEGLFISGWMRDALGALERLEAVSDLGLVFDMTDRIFRFPRPDVREQYADSPYGRYEEEHGFAAYIALTAEQKEAIKDIAGLHSFRLRATLTDGAVMEIIPEAVYGDVFASRDFVLKAVPVDAVGELLLQETIVPASTALQKLCMSQVQIKEVKRFNKKASHVAEVSLVIPLYKKLEYIKSQLACFAADSDLSASCEIIYVLDSPEQVHAVHCMLQELCAIYPLAVTLVIMNRNSGYAAANNHGVAVASGETLLFMNSDVLPKDLGWVGEMKHFYDKKRRIGALAPKLLYEDGSLQHAGMVFEKRQFPFWLNLHQWKGYTADYSPACRNSIVPAVTGACMMIDKSIFSAVGGFTTDYVIGDFEDSDLCLKLTDAGYDSWYLADVELYHLERQSMSLSDGYHGGYAWQVNARLHTERWEASIEKLMRHVDSGDNTTEPKAENSVMRKVS